MYHPAVAVSAFAGEVQLGVRGVVFVVGELDALLDQPADAGRAALDGELHRRFVAKPDGHGMALRRQPQRAGQAGGTAAENQGFAGMHVVRIARLLNPHLNL